MELQLYTFLTSALDGGEWLASRPGGCTPGNSQRNSVGVAITLRTERFRVRIPLGARDFILSRTSRPVLRPTQPAERVLFCARGKAAGA